MIKLHHRYLTKRFLHMQAMNAVVFSSQISVRKNNGSDGRFCSNIEKF